jgi:hypothetical protein
VQRQRCQHASLPRCIRPVPRLLPRPMVSLPPLHPEEFNARLNRSRLAVVGGFVELKEQSGTPGQSRGTWPAGESSKTLVCRRCLLQRGCLNRGFWNQRSHRNAGSSAVRECLRLWPLFQRTTPWLQGGPGCRCCCETDFPPCRCPGRRGRVPYRTGRWRGPTRQRRAL